MRCTLSVQQSICFACRQAQVQLQDQGVGDVKVICLRPGDLLPVRADNNDLNRLGAKLLHVCTCSHCVANGSLPSVV